MLSGGTVISFELEVDKKKETFEFINKLEMIDISNNLGDTKTLITHPSTTTHHRLTSAEKKTLGIGDNLIRLSVGLEDIDDIINDIKIGLT